MHVSRSEALLHPVRLRIVLILAARSNLTAQEIGRFLDDVPQATLYRHLNNLREADIIRVVEERPTGGSLERVYALNEGATYLSPADLERATKDDHMRYFTTFCVHLLGLFGTYLRRERIDLARDGVGYQTHVMHLESGRAGPVRRRIAAAHVVLHVQGAVAAAQPPHLHDDPHPRRPAA